MDLWTEYEGRTIDGAFPLTKLLRPEGRSAFFSTSNGTGVPTVIRLIESHFDEDEILARWRRVEALNHGNLVKLKRYGPAELDGTSLIYAVMEPVDANLGEIVGERRLTVLETKQIATSLLAALEALHANGFVHEHVEAANVLAVGEVIKLRSDCIRETPEGEAGRELKAKDVHDFAVVLLQALTQRRTLEDAVRWLPLDAPFDQIVRKGMSGEWGLGEIATALEQMAAPRTVAAAIPVTAGHVRAVPAPLHTAATESKGVDAFQPRARVRVPVEDGAAGFGGSGLKIVVGFVVLLAVLLGWHFLRGGSATAGVPQQSPVAAAPILDGGVARPAVVTAPAAPSRGAVGVARQWRVIAYTYNHEDQAKAKAAAVAQAHSELRPEVFAPNGHAPYLVVVGGKMSRDEAFALVKTGQSDGSLPHDSYAQNYIGKGR